MAGAGRPPGGTPGGALPAAAAGAGGGCALFMAGEGGENLQSENLSVSLGGFERDRRDFERACILHHQNLCNSQYFFLKLKSDTECLLEYTAELISMQII